MPSDFDMSRYVYEDAVYKKLEYGTDIHWTFFIDDFFVLLHVLSS